MKNYKGYAYFLMIIVYYLTNYNHFNKKFIGEVSIYERFCNVRNRKGRLG
jgi:hypothetical protein